MENDSFSSDSSGDEEMVMIMTSEQIEKSTHWNTNIIAPYAAFESCGMLLRNFHARTGKFLFHVIPSIITSRIIYGVEQRRILETDLPIPRNIDDNINTPLSDGALWFTVHELAHYDNLEELPNFMEKLSAQDTHTPSTYEIVALTYKQGTGVEWIVVKHQEENSDLVKVSTLQKDTQYEPVILETSNRANIAVHVTTCTPTPCISCVYRNQNNKLMLNIFKMGEKLPFFEVEVKMPLGDNEVTSVTILESVAEYWHYLFGLSNGTMVFLRQNTSSSSGNRQAFLLVGPKLTHLGSIVSLLQVQQRIVILGSNKLVITKSDDTQKLKNLSRSLPNEKGNKKHIIPGVFWCNLAEHENEQAQRMCLNASSTLLATITNRGVLRIFQVNFSDGKYELAFQTSFVHEGGTRNCLSLSFDKKFATGDKKTRELVVVCFEQGLVYVVEPIYQHAVKTSNIKLDSDDLIEL
nr:unnamed protein product [Naegleria fowleri]